MRTSKSISIIFLATVVVVTFGYTQCTQGIFALVPAVMAMGDVEETMEGGPLMSVERNLCGSSEEDVIAQKTSTPKGCSGGACLENGSDTLSVRLANSQQYEGVDTFPTAGLPAYSHGTSDVHARLVPRSEPLFADARTHVRSIVKRE